MSFDCRLDGCGVSRLWSGVWLENKRHSDTRAYMGELEYIMCSEWKWFPGIQG